MRSKPEIPYLYRVSKPSSPYLYSQLSEKMFPLVQMGFRFNSHPPFSLQNMAAQHSYSGGGPALAFNDKGVGFGYYKNGKIALAVNEVSDYQTSCFAYDSNKKGTLLIALDSRTGIGYVQTSASSDKQMSLTMTEEGGALDGK